MVTVTLPVPRGKAGTLKTVEILPVALTIPTPTLMVPNLILNVLFGVKPVPVTITDVSTGPSVGEMLIEPVAAKARAGPNQTNIETSITSDKKMRKHLVMFT